SSRDCTADRFRHSARRTEGTATGNARFHPEHARSAGGNGAARGRFRGVRGARLDTRAFPSAALRQEGSAAFTGRPGGGGIPQRPRRSGEATATAAETEDQALGLHYRRSPPIDWRLFWADANR